jgi:hypothetical protein
VSARAYSPGGVSSPPAARTAARGTAHDRALPDHRSALRVVAVSPNPEYSVPQVRAPSSVDVILRDIQVVCIGPENFVTFGTRP